MKRSLAVTGGVFVCGTVIAVGATAYGLSADSGGPAPSGASLARPAADGDGGDGDDGDDGDGKGPERFLDELPRLKGLDGLDDLADTQLLHSETAVEDEETGDVTYHAGQVGEVTAASGSALTVESSDGVSWKWTLDDDTRIRVEDDADADASAVGVGDEVAVSGTRDGGTRTADHVLAPPPDPEKIREEIEKGLDELPDRLPELREKLPEEFREKLPDSLEDLWEGQRGSRA